MRDLDRFNKRTPVRREDEYFDSGINSSWFGTVFRLSLVFLCAGLFAWGAWKVSQPANIWTTSSDIHKTERDLRLIHEDAEKARREMERSSEISVETLVYHALKFDYELTPQERKMVMAEWDRLMQEEQILDDEELLFKLQMRRNKEGVIEDFPLDEWKKCNEEKEKARELKKKDEYAKQAVADSMKEIVQKDANSERRMTKAQDEQMRSNSRKRSDREEVKRLIQEYNEELYRGKISEGSEAEGSASDAEPVAEKKEDTPQKVETVSVPESVRESESVPASEASKETGSEVEPGTEKNIRKSK